MRKITLFALGAFFYSNCAFAQPDFDQLDSTDFETNLVNSEVISYTPPEGSLFIEKRADLYNFYESLEKYGMISVDPNSNTAKIEGYVFLNNFEYEIDLVGIAISVLNLCTANDKISVARAKIKKWQENLIKNIHNKNPYKDEDYIKFIKLFSNVFFETTSDKLAKFDSIEFDLKLSYIDPEGLCSKFCQKILHYISLASDELTSMQELFANDSYIKGKYKYEQTSATEYEVKSIE